MKLDFWGLCKTPHFPENLDFVWEWYNFLNMPLTGAVRRRERDEVNLTP